MWPVWEYYDKSLDGNQLWIKIFSQAHKNGSKGSYPLHTWIYAYMHECTKNQIQFNVRQHLYEACCGYSDAFRQTGYLLTDQGKINNDILKKSYIP